MEKLKQMWSDWRGSIGFVGGMLVVSTTYFTCSFDVNEGEVVNAVLKEEAVEEVQEEAPAEEEAPVEEAAKEEPEPGQAEEAEAEED